MLSKLRELSKPLLNAAGSPISPTSYATASQLRSILDSLLGRPLSPCPTCGQPVVAILQSGATACPECDPSLWNDAEHRPARAVTILLATDHQTNLAVELDPTTLAPIARTTPSSLSASSDPPPPGYSDTITWLNSSIIEAIFEPDPNPSSPSSDLIHLWSRPGTSITRRQELLAVAQWTNQTGTPRHTQQLSRDKVQGKAKARQKRS
jgi:uncharacterized Zn finger protein (UPF0148 family)